MEERIISFAAEHGILIIIGRLLAVLLLDQSSNKYLL